MANLIRTSNDALLLKYYCNIKGSARLGLVHDLSEKFMTTCDIINEIQYEICYDSFNLFIRFCVSLQQV